MGEWQKKVQPAMGARARSASTCSEPCMRLFISSFSATEIIKIIAALVKLNFAAFVRSQRTVKKLSGYHGGPGLLF
jgi:hypothetical protein